MTNIIIRARLCNIHLMKQCHYSLVTAHQANGSRVENHKSNEWPQTKYEMSETFAYTIFNGSALFSFIHCCCHSYLFVYYFSHFDILRAQNWYRETNWIDGIVLEMFGISDKLLECCVLALTVDRAYISAIDSLHHELNGPVFYAPYALCVWSTVVRECNLIFLVNHRSP